MGLAQTLAVQVAAWTEGLSGGSVCATVPEGLSGGSVVYAEEQTVKDKETGLGAFLGAGGVGG